MDVADTELVACDYEIIIFKSHTLFCVWYIQVWNCVFVNALKYGLMIILYMW